MRAGNFFKKKKGGGQTIKIIQIATQIARIDRFLARVKFSQADKLFEFLLNTRRPVHIVNTVVNQIKNYFVFYTK